MYNIKSEAYKSFCPEDKGYKFVKNGVEYPRAVIDVSEKCPYSYRKIVMLCQAKGWIKPIAYVPTYEYMWEELQR